MAVHEIIRHIREAQRLASAIGITNILQPGVVKELILADLLRHTIMPSKDKADAEDAEGNHYEYLCSLERSNNFQIDRVTRQNLHRITRNKCFYFAFFSDAITVSSVYSVDTHTVLREVERQLAKSKNPISHTNLTGGWVRRNGVRVLPTWSGVREETCLDLHDALPSFLPQAITWAQHQATQVQRTGQALSASDLDLARKVGVGQPECVRVAVVEALPMPDDPVLQHAAVETGLLGPRMVGLTLGHSVFICRGHGAVRLLSHEFRHVYQYEEAGSIAEFLRVYLQQVVQHGYDKAPLELDAIAHEQPDP